MKTENPIDEFIRKEKSIQAGPDLTNKIMDQLHAYERNSIARTDLNNARMDGTSRANVEQEKPARKWRLHFGSGSQTTNPAFQDHSRLPGWQVAAIAASFALVIATGIGTGRMYSVSANNATALNINDTHIENHSLLNSLAYE